MITSQCLAPMPRWQLKGTGTQGNCRAAQGKGLKVVCSQPTVLADLTEEGPGLQGQQNLHRLKWRNGAKKTKQTNRKNKKTSANDTFHSRNKKLLTKFHHVRPFRISLFARGWWRGRWEGGPGWKQRGSVYISSLGHWLERYQDSPQNMTRHLLSLKTCARGGISLTEASVRTWAKLLI